MVRLVAAARMAPLRTTTAPIGTSFRFTASRARSSAFRMYCSSIARGGAATPSCSLAVLLSAGKCWLFRFLERQLALGVALNDDVISFAEAAFEHGKRERILQETLNRPLEWTRTKRGIVSLRSENFARFGRQLQRELPVSQQPLQLLQLQIDDV